MLDVRPDAGLQISVKDDRPKGAAILFVGLLAEENMCRLSREGVIRNIYDEK